MDTEDVAGKNWEGIEHYSKNLNCFRESLNHHEQTVIRNLDFKNPDGEDSEGRTKHVTETGGRRKTVMWWQKAQRNCNLQLCQEQNFVTNLDIIPKEISKRSVEGAGLFLLAAYTKI